MFARSGFPLVVALFLSLPAFAGEPFLAFISGVPKSGERAGVATNTAGAAVGVAAERAVTGHAMGGTVAGAVMAVTVGAVQMAGEMAEADKQPPKPGFLFEIMRVDQNGTCVTENTWISKPSVKAMIAAKQLTLLRWFTFTERAGEPVFDLALPDAAAVRQHPCWQDYHARAVKAGGRLQRDAETLYATPTPVPQNKDTN